jgi:hypothetical protein
VKRSSDTRIRREVVGQMLDYAANAVLYWPVVSLRDALDRTAAAGSTGDDALLAIWPDLDVDTFWRSVAANLTAGRIRLLFVADELPPNLVRVLEFLNAQMSPAEVLGVELRQYLGPNGHVVLVPSVVGRTTAAVAAKERATAGTLSTRESLIADAQERFGPSAAALVEMLLDDAERTGLRLAWGRGVSESVGTWGPVAGTETRVWMIQMGSDTPGDPARLEVHFARVLTSLTSRQAALNRLEVTTQALEAISSMRARVQDSRTRGWATRPGFPLVTLAEDPASREFLCPGLRQLLDRPEP